MLRVVLPAPFAGLHSWKLQGAGGDHTHFFQVEKDFIFSLFLSKIQSHFKPAMPVLFINCKQWTPVVL